MLLYYWGRALRQAMTGGVTHVFIVLIANNRVRLVYDFWTPRPLPSYQICTCNFKNIQQN